VEGSEVCDEDALMNFADMGKNDIPAFIDAVRYLTAEEELAD
jgi:hypothetical protein